ncbi:hypothetical protein [Streptomyces sp. NBC_00239]|uniref:hypothetical protein n=1 Tax=Streptomyces sp. NBC_00239 TaxID=2903640 RepID=UPI002E2BEFF7|nr:hypothetical protein [Streptomyces sp. NBC_00239]
MSSDVHARADVADANAREEIADCDVCAALQRDVERYSDKGSPYYSYALALEAAAELQEHRAHDERGYRYGPQFTVELRGAVDRRLTELTSETAWLADAAACAAYVGDILGEVRPHPPR